MSTSVSTDPLRPVAHRGLLITLGVIGIALTVVVGLAVTSAPAWLDAETALLEAIGRVRTPAGTAFAEFLAWLFSPTIAVIISVAVAVLIALTTRSAKRTLVFAALVAVGWCATETMKWVVQRPRPVLTDPVVPPPSSFSYPSGHTAFACAIVIAVLLTLRTMRHRWIADVLGAALVLAVAWSRVYLGVHFVTDVSAAIVLTVSVAAIVIPLMLNVTLPLLADDAHRPDDAQGRDPHHDAEG